MYMYMWLNGMGGMGEVLEACVTTHLCVACAA